MMEVAWGGGHLVTQRVFCVFSKACAVPCRAVLCCVVLCCALQMMLTRACWRLSGGRCIPKVNVMLCTTSTP